MSCLAFLNVDDIKMTQSLSNNKQLSPIFSIFCILFTALGRIDQDDDTDDIKMSTVESI